MNKRLVVGAGIIGVVVIVAVAVSFAKSQLRHATSSDGDYAVGSVGITGKTVAPQMAYGESAGENNFALRDSGSMPAPSTPGSSAIDIANRLIIKTGYLSVVVSDVHQAVDSVSRYAEEKGGFVVSSNVSKEQLAPTATVVLRIPAKEFDAAVTNAKNLGEDKSEQINGQDVTEEYTDLDAQIRNLRASEAQLLELMKRAGSVSDILAVQQQLTYTRGQIEQIQGRMEYLKQSSDLSTLTIYLSTDPDSLPVVNQEEKWKLLAEAKQALRSLIDMGKGIVDAIIWILIFSPVWFLIGLVVWLVRRKIVNRTNGV